MEWVLITPFGGASQFTPVFLGGTCCSIFRILCSVLQIIACPFSFGHCFTASDYSFGIYERFLHTTYNNICSMIYYLIFSIFIMCFIYYISWTVAIYLEKLDLSDGSKRRTNARRTPRWRLLDALSMGDCQVMIQKAWPWT